MGSVALSLGTLVIRTDSSVQIGIGHIMRCFALAQAWKLKGGQVIFLSHCESDSIRQRISKADMEFFPINLPHPDLKDLEISLDIMRKQSVVTNKKPVWIILDGYHFDSYYQKHIKEAGFNLLVIDDMAHLEHYYADILLNQNIYADLLQYPCELKTTLLLGTQYVMLRQEFLSWRNWKRKIPTSTNRVMVTIGGIDPDNQTGRIIKALKLVRIKDMEVLIVSGPGNPYYEVLSNELIKMPFPARILHDVNNMPELMAWADIAVTSGGSTCWELAFMGLPAIVGQISEVEGFLVNGLKKNGLFLRAGWFVQLSIKDIADLVENFARNDELKSSMSNLGRLTVDGYGCDRIIKVVQTHERIYS